MIIDQQLGPFQPPAAKLRVRQVWMELLPGIEPLPNSVRFGGIVRLASFLVFRNRFLGPQLKRRNV
jgi:hypothetical protein